MPPRALIKPFYAILCAGLIPISLLAQAEPSRDLPAPAASKAAMSIDAARPHRRHLWRDTPPFPSEGRVTAFIEIPRGERRKWEFHMAKNTRAIDRIIPASIGGYPINYGFVPQTVSYDGDPFDALVLGPAIGGGRLVQGVVVGLMQMMDGGVIDSKVILSPVDRQGRPRYQLTDRDRQVMTAFFNDYKDHEPGTSTDVPGWGDAASGWAFVRTTHDLFRQQISGR
jgi:inorganic pyrophosphatase